MSEKSKLATDLEGLSAEQFKKANAAFNAEATKRGLEGGPTVGELAAMPEHEQAKYARDVSAKFSALRAKENAKKLLEG